MDKYSFFGEFGFLNLEILGKLDRYFKIHPKKKILIITFDNYKILLAYLFPKNIVLKSRAWTDDFSSNIKRDGYGSLLKNGFKNLKDISNIRDLPIYRIKDPEMIRISSKLEFGKCSEKKYISIFPRNRKASSYKNISEDDWMEIIKKMDGFGYKIVVHGAGKEFIKIKGKNIIYPKNVLDQVKYLNNSICSICPDSGFAHFSLNCGCDTLVIGKSYWPFIQFNPFNNRLEVISLRRATNTGFVGDFISGKSHKLYHLWFYYIYTPPRRVSTFVYWKLFKLFTKAFPGLKTQIKRFLKKN